MQTLDYSLYLVTDRALMSTKTLQECVEEALRGGCTMVQLREKELDAGPFYRLGKSIKTICDRYHVPLIINDRVDVALALQARGVHIGQNDLDCQTTRKLVGPNMLLGVSVTTVGEALKAEAEGADYLGVGAMFATATKEDAQLVSLEELKRIREAVSIPLVVIGGMNEQTIPLCVGMGIQGVAVVSAVVSKHDIASSSSELKQLIDSVIR